MGAQAGYGFAVTGAASCHPVASGACRLQHKLEDTAKCSTSCAAPVQVIVVTRQAGHHMDALVRIV